MATLGDALKQGKCWDALPVSDRNKIVGASSLENIAVMTPFKSWADLTDLEREAMLAVDWQRVTMSAPERCTVCFNPAQSVNADGFCSFCVEADLQRDIHQSRVAIRARVAQATQQEERDALAAIHEQQIPTPQELLDDPCSPFWAKDVIRVALTKDVVDAAGVFALLAKVFEGEANYALYGTRDGKRATKF